MIKQLLSQQLDRFRKEFVATGADIEGMKRVEYRQLREHQVDQAISFLSQCQQELLDKVCEMVEGMENHTCKISETGWTNYSEEYRKQTEKYGTEKYHQALDDLKSSLKENK